MGACPFLVHTLIVNTFNFFAGFAKLAKNSHVVREVKVSQTIDLKGIKISSLIMKNLLEQLQICVVTGSQQNLLLVPRIPSQPSAPCLLTSTSISPHTIIISRTPIIIMLVESFVVVPVETRGGLVAKEAIATSASPITIPDHRERPVTEAPPMELTHPLLAPLLTLQERNRFFRRVFHNDTVRRSSTPMRRASLRTSEILNIASSPKTSHLQILQP